MLKSTNKITIVMVAISTDVGLPSDLVGVVAIFGLCLSYDITCLVNSGRTRAGLDWALAQCETQTP